MRNPLKALSAVAVSASTTLPGPEAVVFGMALGIRLMEKSAEDAKQIMSLVSGILVSENDVMEDIDGIIETLSRA